jgi:hypothetical protein
VQLQQKQQNLMLFYILHHHHHRRLRLDHHLHFLRHHLQQLSIQPLV